MNIAIIDADLIGKSKHRFPNLASMKISSYWKNGGASVCLKTDYNDLDKYDRVFISKVFTDTFVDNSILDLPNVEYGGTGFFYDKAPRLSNEIEHIFPDYHLYDDWVKQKIEEGKPEKEFTYYKDYSIGFTTRGCIRQCNFCVNQNYKTVNLHSSIDEFMDIDRKYICLLDDNILACKDWKVVLDELISTGKRFQFKQGMDERLLTDEKCDYLFNKCNYIGDYIFAFDNLKDRFIIEKKLQMIKEHTNKVCKFYLFCGFNHNNPDHYSKAFWDKDIIELLERIKILMQYKQIPYIMRYKDYELSPHKAMYVNLARWCNQPSFFKKLSFREFCEKEQEMRNSDKLCASMRCLIEYEKEFPNTAKRYFNMKY